MSPDEMAKWSKALTVRSGKLSNFGPAVSILRGQKFWFSKSFFHKSWSKIFAPTFEKKNFFYFIHVNFMNVVQTSFEGSQRNLHLSQKSIFQNMSTNQTEIIIAI